ncbi:hypothetical protein Kpol_1053p32, partial [Vanderwaltozyma polyspora DSM 70294]
QTKEVNFNESFWRYYNNDLNRPLENINNDYAKYLKLHRDFRLGISNKRLHSTSCLKYSSNLFRCIRKHIK